MMQILRLGHCIAEYWNSGRTNLHIYYMMLEYKQYSYTDGQTYIFIYYMMLEYEKEQYSYTDGQTYKFIHYMMLEYI